MRDFNFKITDIKSERHMQGTTFIHAICLETNATIIISIPNYAKNNRELVREILTEEHLQYMNYSKYDLIQVGEVL